MSGFAVLLIFIAIVMGIIYYFTTCRKITSIQQEAKNYIEQKDFDEMKATLGFEDPNPPKSFPNHPQSSKLLPNPSMSFQNPP